jgi:hypothetical protein
METVVFWIVLELEGDPLVFIRESSVNKSHYSYKFDEENKYVFVKDMKAGEMVVFRASETYHASAILVDPKRQGGREAVSLVFGRGGG